MRMSKNILTDFATGLIIGFLGAVVIFGVITGVYFYNKKDKEFTEYAEKQIEINELREEINSLDSGELVDTVPGVRRAVDGAAAEFERKRNEALHRFRSGNSD
jgi:H+/gluconate symporter-like permease